MFSLPEDLTSETHFSLVLESEILIHCIIRIETLLLHSFILDIYIALLQETLEMVTPKTYTYHHITGTPSIHA